MRQAPNVPPLERLRRLAAQVRTYEDNLDRALDDRDRLVRQLAAAGVAADQLREAADLDQEEYLAALDDG